MKELTEDHKDNEVEIVIEQQQRKEVKLIAQHRKIPGLTVWEFNVKTLELIPATFKNEDVTIRSFKKSHDIIKHNKVDIKPDCIYFQALNEKSARRKLKL
jgi:hypothetical protein